MESPTLNRLIANLRKLRRRHGLTQEGFAELAELGYKYYQAVEAGRKRQLRLSTLDRLARAYHLEVYQLLSPNPRASRIGKRKSAQRRTKRA